MKISMGYITGRAIGGLLLMGLLVGCSQGEGDRCQINSDCASDLICCVEAQSAITGGTCQLSTNCELLRDGGVPDISVPDGSLPDTNQSETSVDSASGDASNDTAVDGPLVDTSSDSLAADSAVDTVSVDIGDDAQPQDSATE